MITQLYNLGLSVSYYRVLQLEDQLANVVCGDYRSKGAVVPAQLRSGLFTVGALDNLGHNPSSSTTKGSFHSTGISLFQFPTAANLGVKQNDIRLHLVDTKSVSIPQLLSVPDLKEGQLISAKLKENSW